MKELVILFKSLLQQDDVLVLLLVTLVYLMLELGVSLHQHGHELLILGVLLLKLLLDQCCQHVLGGARLACVRYLGA